MLNDDLLHKIDKLEKKQQELENRLFLQNIYLSSILDFSKKSTEYNSDYEDSITRVFGKGSASPMFIHYYNYALLSNERGNKLAAALRSISEVAGIRFLDIGCGWGGQVIAMASSGVSESIGIDIDDRLIYSAECNAARFNLNCKFKVLDVLGEEVTAVLGQFDLISCIDVIEHVIDPKLLVFRLRQLLKKGKKAVIHIPNRNSIRQVIKDPHHHLFGQIRLSRENQRRYMEEYYKGNKTFTLGFFYDWEVYEKWFKDYGLEIKVQNLLNISKKEILDELKKELDALTSSKEEFSNVKTKISLDLYDEIVQTVSEYMDQISSELLESDESRLWFKYLLPVWHVVVENRR